MNDRGLKIATESNVGHGRETNQDAILVVREIGGRIGTDLCLVSDGIGGLEAGDLASALAVQSVRTNIENKIDGAPTVLSRQLIDSALNQTNRFLRMFASQAYGRSNAMGCTLVGLLTDGCNTIGFSLGDGGFYSKAGGKLKRMNHVHRIIGKPNLITKSLGISEVLEPEYFYLKMNVGDYVLLCTDGVSEHVLIDEIDIALSFTGSTLDSICSLIANKAMLNGNDDASLCIVKREG